MRIISGKYKGRKIKALDIMDVRPTSDKVRGALFNILGEKIRNSSFLDLYAGSGAVGIEALSRGAKNVYFVEDDFKVFKLIQENIANLKIKEDYEILKDFPKQKKFDIIFLDPPYTKADIKDLELINENNLLADNGIIIFEHDKILNFKSACFELFYEKKYGKTLLSFFK